MTQPLSGIYVSKNLNPLDSTHKHIMPLKLNVRRLLLWILLRWRKPTATEPSRRRSSIQLPPRYDHGDPTA